MKTGLIGQGGGVSRQEAYFSKFAEIAQAEIYSINSQAPRDRFAAMAKHPVYPLRQLSRAEFAPPSVIQGGFSFDGSFNGEPLARFFMPNINLSPAFSNVPLKYTWAEDFMPEPQNREQPDNILKSDYLLSQAAVSILHFAPYIPMDPIDGISPYLIIPTDGRYALGNMSYDPNEFQTDSEVIKQLRIANDMLLDLKWPELSHGLCEKGFSNLGNRLNFANPVLYTNYFLSVALQAKFSKGEV